MLKSRSTRLLGALASAALIVPAAAYAGSENSGSGSANSGRNSKSYEFKAVVTSVAADPSAAAEDVVVEVSGGNRRAREYVGQSVAFDLSGARVKARDVNGDGTRDLADVVPGDKVRVQARLARDGSSVPPFPARKLQVKYPDSE